SRTCPHGRTGSSGPRSRAQKHGRTATEVVARTGTGVEGREESVSEATSLRPEASGEQDDRTDSRSRSLSAPVAVGGPEGKRAAAPGSGEGSRDRPTSLSSDTLSKN